MVAESVKPGITIIVEIVNNVPRLTKGAHINTIEMIQAKHDLGRTQYAERVNKAYKTNKNSVLQTGGVLTVEHGRAMVHQTSRNAPANAAGRNSCNL